MGQTHSAGVPEVSSDPLPPSEARVLSLPSQLFLCPARCPWDSALTLGFAEFLLS